jgi:TonB-dependent receptor
MRRHFSKSALSVAATQALLLCSGPAMAQSAASVPGAAASGPAASASAPAASASAPAASAPAPAQADQQSQSVVVTGQRAALQSAQAIKRNAEQIVDAVVAEEAGKLPDKSITEVLQRVVGVTMDRNKSPGDPEHFSVEGSGVQVRGLSWGSSTLNGRESFSAGFPGRSLSWSDVPPELMAAVLVYKNPSSELIEGGISGQVDLRTAMPFDYKETKFSISANDNYNVMGSKNSPGVSGIFSKRWSNGAGEWGALVDLSFNQTNTHNDTVELDAYFPRSDLVPGKTVWIPQSASWRTNTSQGNRAGVYAALQWKNDNKESSLTIFDSFYKDTSTEHALHANGINPYLIQVDPTTAVYNGNVLVSGSYTLPMGQLGSNNFAAGGLGYDTDSGRSVSHAQTRDIAWNFKWDVNDRVSLQNDLQWVHATDDSFSDYVALGTFIPVLNLRTSSSGGPPALTFSPSTAAFLQDPANYYLDNAMPMQSKATGNMVAWKGDAQFKINGDVLRDFRFGVRLTDRSAKYMTPSGTGWYSWSDPWNVRQTQIPGTLPNSSDQPSWGTFANFGYLKPGSPYAALVPTQVQTFTNYFNGKIALPPGLVFPSMSLPQGYPSSFVPLMAIPVQECLDGNAQFGTTTNCQNAAGTWTPFTYDNNPANTSRTDEQTQALYGTLRFAEDGWRFPVEGNAGLRVVRTRTISHAYTVFTPGSNPPPEVPAFGAINAPHDSTTIYTDFLPSLNLKTDLTSKLQGRFAVSKGIYRPDFGQLQGYETLAQTVTQTSSGAITDISYTGNAKGNPRLKPIRSNNFDVTLEWNPTWGQSLTGAVFYKQLRDIILPGAHVESYADLAGNKQDFVITAPDNLAKGSVAGFEVGGMTYLDKFAALDRILPDWAKGFGVSANYTFIDSHQQLYHPFNLQYCPASSAFNNSNLNIYGCDTNGLPFKSLPIQYLSKNAVNFALLYDHGPLSARLAYNWRSRYLQGVNNNSTSGTNGTSADPSQHGAQNVGWGLPVWLEGLGQWDAGIDYKLQGDRWLVSLSVTNLTNTMGRQTQEQTPGYMGRAWYEYGRSFRLSTRYNF